MYRKFLILSNSHYKGGIYYFTLIDFYSAGTSLFYTAFFEIIAVLWIYGGKRLAKNIYSMTGQKPNAFFLVCWYVVSPAFVFSIWALNWYEYEPIKYGKYEYPLSMKILGWLITLLSIISIPFCAIHTLIKAPGDSFKDVGFYFKINFW